MGDVKRVQRKAWQGKKKYKTHKRPNQRFYNGKPWRDYRLLKLTRNPHCEECLKRKIFSPGYYVDHDQPINEGGALFPPLDELTTLCISCDARKRQTESTRAKRQNENKEK